MREQRSGDYVEEPSRGLQFILRSYDNCHEDCSGTRSRCDMSGKQCINRVDKRENVSDEQQWHYDSHGGGSSITPNTWV